VSNSAIVIRLELDDANFRGTITGALGDLRLFDRRLREGDRALDRHSDAHRRWGRTLRDSIIVLGLARHALENVNALLFAMPMAIIRSNAQLEKMNTLMIGLSSVTGGFAEAQEDATKSMDFLFDMARRSPFEIAALTDSFVKFKAAGLDPLGGLFQGLVDSVAKFGGTAESLKRASVAIQQMSGKGVISMEELRQQLGEAVPDAMQVMARSMGVTMAELVDVVSTGTLEAKNALTAMGRQMNIENSGAALMMSETWDGLINRMKTSFTMAAKVIGEAGFFDAAKGQLSFFVEDFMQNPAFFQAMQTLGEAMTSTINSVASVIESMYKYRDVIVDVTKYAAAFWLVMKVKNNWTSLVGGFTAVRGAMTSTVGGFRSMRTEMTRVGERIRIINGFNRNFNTNARIQSVVLAQLTVVANRAAAAFTRLWTAMGGWIGVAMIAVPAILFGMDRIKDKAYETAKAIDTINPSFMTKDQTDALEQQLGLYKELKAQLDAMPQPELPTGSFASDPDGFKKYKEDMGRYMDLRRKVAKFESELFKDTSTQATQDLINAAREEHRSNNLDSFERTLENLATGQLRELRNATKKELQEAIDGRGAKTDEQFLAQRKAVEGKQLAGTAAFYDEQYALQVAIVEKNRNLQTEAGKNEVIDAQERMERIKQIKEKALNVFNGDLGEVETIENKKNAVALDSFEKFLLSKRKIAAKYDAKAEEENTYLAEFEAMNAMGSFGKLTAAQIGLARREMDALWESRKRFDAQNAETKAFADAMERIDQLTGMVNSKFAQRENSNPLLRDAIEAEKLKAKLAEVGEELDKLNNKEGKEQGLARLAELGRQIDINARAATVTQIKSATDAMNTELLPEMKRVEAQYDKLRAQALAWKAANDELTPEQLQAFADYMDAISRKMADDMKTPMQELLTQWGDGTAQMQNLWTNTMTSFVDTLTDGLMEGKLELSSFVEEFARMIIKMQMQKAAAGIVMGLGSMFAGGGAAMTADGYGVSPGGVAFANGGIMTNKGSLALKAYSNGGIANKPQLALYGEGRQPEAYVPLPDGRTIPVTMSGGGGTNAAPSVTVNLLNQSGESMEAEAGQPSFDGERYVLDIVLSGASRPGNFRSGLKSALTK
jgi:lambda family phage tail tape measure protein